MSFLLFGACFEWDEQATPRLQLWWREPLDSAGPAHPVLLLDAGIASPGEKREEGTGNRRSES